MAAKHFWIFLASLGAASAAARADTPFARPMITITLDDGLQSQFDLARPALNRRGLKATYYLISQPIKESWSGYLSTFEARTLVAEGNEIAAHTVTHPHLTTVSAAQLDQELSTSRAWLQSNLGVATVSNFASPYGEYNEAVLGRIRANFGSHRTQAGGRAFSDHDRYQLRGVYVRSTTTVAEIESWVDQAAVEGSWLILTFHEFTTAAPSRETQYSASGFAAVLDYIQARGIAVVTVAGGLAQMGQTQDIQPRKWFYGDWFGNDVEDWSWAKVTFGETAVVHDGHSAISFEPDGWGGLAFHLNGGFDASVWSTVQFWVNGGAGGGQRVQVSLHDGNRDRGAVSVAQLLGHPISANTWQLVTLPLAQLGITSGMVSEIYLEDTTGGNQAALYVDSVIVTKASATSPPPVPPPTPASLTIYDDALGAGFEDWSWAVHNLGQTTFVRSGRAAASFEPDNWAGLYFHHAGLDTSNYQSLELYVNGGVTGGQDIVVAVWDGSTELGQVDVTQLLGHAPRPNVWEHVVVPLSALGAKGRPLRDLYLQDNSGANQPAVYIDDIRLIP